LKDDKLNYQPFLTNIDGELPATTTQWNGFVSIPKGEYKCYKVRTVKDATDKITGYELLLYTEPTNCKENEIDPWQNFVHFSISNENLPKDGLTLLVCVLKSEADDNLDPVWELADSGGIIGRKLAKGKGRIVRDL
jgi:hypothetical protein